MTLPSLTETLLDLGLGGRTEELTALVKRAHVSRVVVTETLLVHELLEVRVVASVLCGVDHWFLLHHVVFPALLDQTVVLMLLRRRNLEL